MHFHESYGSIIRPHVYIHVHVHVTILIITTSLNFVVTPPVSRRMLVIDSKNRTQSDARDRTSVKPRGTDKVSPHSSPFPSSPEVHVHPCEKIMYNREI